MGGPSTVPMRNTGLHWFSDQKGVGFIAPDGVNPPVMIPDVSRVQDASHLSASSTAGASATSDAAPAAHTTAAEVPTASRRLDSGR
jgi:hypothetical protein